MSVLHEPSLQDRKPSTPILLESPYISRYHLLHLNWTQLRPAFLTSCTKNITPTSLWTQASSLGWPPYPMLTMPLIYLHSRHYPPQLSVLTSKETFFHPEKHWRCLLT